jgi:alkanesulfonate monooxygenase SsuD/methylene tetrahydromethanopterin reductase-like flavin-dependent oxidoreductase (luciferase family)
VATHWTKYVEGCARTGRAVDPADWRVAKSIFVADDLAQARAYVFGPNSPYRLYYRQLLTKMLKGGRSGLFKEDLNAPDDTIELDQVLDDCVIWGTPDKVADDLLAFRETVGDFGTLLYAGKDWTDPALARRSMVLLAEKVRPKLPALPGSVAAQ